MHYSRKQTNDIHNNDTVIEYGFIIGMTIILLYLLIAYLILW